MHTFYTILITDFGFTVDHSKWVEHRNQKPNLHEVVNINYVPIAVFFKSRTKEESIEMGLYLARFVVGTSRFSARQLRGRTLKYLPQVSFIRAAAGFCDNDAWVTTHWGDIGQKQWCINNADIRVPTFRALARCARLCSAVKTRLYTSSGDERGAPDLRCRESFVLSNPFSARFFLSILSNSY